MIEDTILFERDTVYFNSIEKWILGNQTDSTYIVSSNYFVAELFRKSDNSPTVRTLYDKTKGYYKVETSLFEKEAKLRMGQLSARLNGL
jgi:hypothetical protein